MNDLGPVPLLSVVIPAYNAGEFLLTQLGALAAGEPTAAPLEVIVVDNRSSDGSVDAVRRWAEGVDLDVRVVAAFDRAGEPHARNVGYRAARGSRIAFCDADDRVGPAWARAMESALGEHEYVTGPVHTDGLNPAWLAGMRGSALFDRVTLAHDLVPFAHGCNMGFTRDLLERLGGFDESFLIACDIEIAVRAWRTGVTPAWIPDALVEYRLRGTLREIARQGRSYGRARWRIRRLLPEVRTTRAERVARFRRVLWVVRHVPAALRDEAARARWVWVLSQLDGDLRGMFDRLKAGRHHDR